MSRIIQASVAFFATTLVVALPILAANVAEIDGGRLVAQDDAAGDALDEPDFGDINVPAPDFDPDLEQAGEEAAEGLIAIAMGMIAVIAVGGLIGFVIWIVVCYLFYTCAASIPEEHQQVGPGMVWLMLIPCVNFVIAFIVFPKIAAGFKSYFDAQGRTDVGDCGQQLGLFLAISIVCFVVPYLNAIAMLAALVLLIILLVKFMGYKKEIVGHAA